MNVKKKARRVMSGLLTAVTVLSTVLSPAVAYASDDAGSVKKIPYYEEIKDQLDEDEVVTAKDYEIKVGDNFDVKSDYTGLTIQDDSKVKVTFQEAKDTDGNDFSTDYAKPWSCKYCYWWEGKKKGCSLKQCHYLLSEKKKAVKTTPCSGCPYGKHVPCIGYCIARLHSEMKGKKGRG